MTVPETSQIGIWKGDFGRAYTDRTTFADDKAFNSVYLRRYGRTRDAICQDWLSDVPRDARILEVGSSIGNQLRVLQRLGFRHLYGIEVQRYCVDQAKQLSPGIDIIEALAADIPFKDGYFDLVFTNNVLIHFAPDDLAQVFDEIHRVTRRFVWGFEYYAPDFTPVNYRGNENLLWKADYGRLLHERFSDLRVCREEAYDCLDEPGNVDKAFLLAKP